MSTYKEEYALLLGRMCPENGVVTAIRVARAAGVPPVLAAKCRETTERRYVDEVVAPLLGEDVRWLGEVGGADKLELLVRARCLLFPIDWEEPFGMVMIEEPGRALPDRSDGSVPVTPVCPAVRTRHRCRGWDGAGCQPSGPPSGGAPESTGDQR